MKGHRSRCKPTKARVFEQIVTEVAKTVRRAPLFDAQRRNEGEHRREVQHDSEDKYVAIFHEEPVGSVPRRPTGLCAIVQQNISPQYRYGSVGVNGTNQESVWQRLYGHEGGGTPKFRIGDRIRISKAKRHFEKGYMANWTEELFTIVDTHRSDPPVYRLVDWHGDTLDGTFYEP